MHTASGECEIIDFATASWGVPLIGDPAFDAVEVAVGDAEVA